MATPSPAEAFTLRPPRAADGGAVHDLIARCPPLDTNSLYCNLLQCTHFAETCVVAEAGSRIVGFVSGYRIPRQTANRSTDDAAETLFIWQVAVDSTARGQGLGKRMLTYLLERRDLAGSAELHTTITPSNRASWALFESFARDRGATLDRQVLFDRDAHLDGSHESEMLVRIGSISSTENYRKTA